MNQIINWKRISRKIHYWGAIVIALPIIIVLISGLLLLLKKDIDWIQPPTILGQGNVPTLNMDEIFEVSKSIPEAEISSWEDINRIDLRPSKGVLKVRSNNRWEIQIDHQTGEVLHLDYRRSDFIESIHDGTFFHDKAKLWVFFPASLILLVLWITGIYLFLLPILAKKKAKDKAKKKVPSESRPLTAT